MPPESKPEFDGAASPPETSPAAEAFPPPVDSPPPSVDSPPPPVDSSFDLDAFVDASPPPKRLSVTNLKHQCALSPGLLLGLEEAASVMLERYEHTSPTPGTWIHDATQCAIIVIWAPPDETMKRTHSNIKDATEDAAYAVAISAANALGFEVQGRADQGSGSDYWMVRRGGDPLVIYHLEVSGIGKGGAPGFRLKNKTDQGRGGPARRPGVAVIFRFHDISLHSRPWPDHDNRV